MLILSCSTTLGNCCSDIGVASIVNFFRNAIELLQIIVPIILLLSASVELVKLVKDPEKKNGHKGIYNKFLAAAIVFFIPVMADALFSILPANFTFSACWEQARKSNEVLSQSNKYISPYPEENRKTIYSNPDDYEHGKEKVDTTNNTSNTTSPSGTEPSTSTTASHTGTVSGAEVVAYAKQFVGKPYEHGGSWNGELPYTPTDCVGFVKGVYKHFGIKIPSNVSDIIKNKEKFTIVTDGNVKAGDIVIYEGHRALITGNGNQIVHAMGEAYGIRTSKNYKKSAKNLRYVIRVNAVY